MTDYLSASLEALKDGWRNPDLHAHWSVYNPTQDSELWNKEDSQLAREGRQQVLEKFSNAIGAELSILAQKKHDLGSRRNAAREAELSKEVMACLDNLNHSCKTPKAGTACTFVKTIEGYFYPKNATYITGMSGRYYLPGTKQHDISRVHKTLLAHDHVQRFHPEITSNISVSSVSKDPQEEALAEVVSQVWEPDPGSTEFGNRAVNAGMMLGSRAASVVSTLYSVFPLNQSAQSR